ncbi:hypothetical protein OIO90_003627 [Microbotryomycetes sp. JL221]|nr:hypothetical protein OIO90_003627 [Microbotryomycetes sp. JL221]
MPSSRRSSAAARTAASPIRHHELRSQSPARSSSLGGYSSDGGVGGSSSLNATSGDATMVFTTNSGMYASDNVTIDMQRRMARKERNRMAAQASRDRKKEQLETLEAENQELRQQLATTQRRVEALELLLKDHIPSDEPSGRASTSTKRKISSYPASTSASAPAYDTFTSSSHASSSLRQPKRESSTTATPTLHYFTPQHVAPSPQPPTSITAATQRTRPVRQFRADDVQDDMESQDSITVYGRDEDGNHGMGNGESPEEEEDDDEEEQLMVDTAETPISEVNPWLRNNAGTHAHHDNTANDGGGEDRDDGDGFVAPKRAAGSRRESVGFRSAISTLTQMKTANSHARTASEERSIQS